MSVHINLLLISQRKKSAWKACFSPNCIPQCSWNFEKLDSFAHSKHSNKTWQWENTFPNVKRLPHVKIFKINALLIYLCACFLLHVFGRVLSLSNILHGFVSDKTAERLLTIILVKWKFVRNFKNTWLNGGVNEFHYDFAGSLKSFIFTSYHRRTLLQNRLCCVPF